MAKKHNLTIDQGSTFSTDLAALTDENGDVLPLSGYTANSQLRKWYTSTNAVAFSTSINVSSGVISLSLTSNQTSNLVAGRYVYDVEISNGSVISRVSEGIVTVSPNVTR